MADPSKIQVESSDNNKVSAYDPSGLTPDQYEELTRSSNLTHVRITKHINYYYPVFPSKSTRKILNLPPDDWRLEMKVTGSRVFIVSQPEETTHGIDLRSVRYEVRAQLVTKLVKRLAQEDPKANVKVIPAVDYNFPGAFDEWKQYPIAEGVVIKQRNSHYPVDIKTATKIKSWKLLEYAKE